MLLLLLCELISAVRLLLCGPSWVTALGSAMEIGGSSDPLPPPLRWMFFNVVVLALE